MGDPRLTLVLLLSSRPSGGDIAQYPLGGSGGSGAGGAAAARENQTATVAATTTTTPTR